MNFRKTVLAVSLSACTGAAMAADKVPTLGDVLKASDISITGYIDVSHNYLSTDAGSSNFRVFDTERRGFSLQTVDLSIGYLPAKGFGSFVQLDHGSDARVVGAATPGTMTANGGDDSEVQEAYMQYAAGPLTVIGGKFATLAGAEVIESPSNTNFSRSYLFGYAVPFTHTGVRASYAPSDTLKFIAGVNNGWDAVKTSAKSGAEKKTIELGVSASPAKMLTLAASYYTGEENGAGGNDTRTLLDVVATINVSDNLNFVLNYDKGDQDKALASGATAKWDGLAGYANYKLSDQYRLSLRAESFNDKNCYRTGCGFTSQKLKETTLTLGYMPAKNVEMRAEYRKDKSDQAVFTENGSTKTSQDSLGLEAIYKF